jgi:hypothetical protein
MVSIKLFTVLCFIYVCCCFVSFLRLERMSLRCLERINSNNISRNGQYVCFLVDCVFVNLLVRLVQLVRLITMQIATNTLLLQVLSVNIVCCVLCAVLGAGFGFH